ncbi:MAG: hypothetical protein H7287_04005 [Thermoleophilia bacterium]|nr:hypothetical protein [Thermoleophilia bacterium]
MTYSHQQHAPLPDEQFAAPSGGLPALALPPVPFGRAQTPFAAPAFTAAPAPIDAPVSAGSAVDAMLAQLTSGLDMTAPQPQAPPAPQPAPVADEFNIHGLQPARRYEASTNRAPQPTTVLSTRPNIAQTMAPIAHPLGAPTNVAPPAAAPAAGFAPTSAELDSVYATIVGNAGVGRLDPFPGQAPLTAPQMHPSMSNGLDPAVAAAAAAPSAWFGGNVQADDQLLVWNSQGSAAAAAPALAGPALAAPHAGRAPHVPAGLAAAAAAPSVAAHAAATAPAITPLTPPATGRSFGASLLRWLLFAGVPAVLGIGIAAGASRLLL